MQQKEFSEGDLVLVRNTAIEKELNRKTKPRYLGPYEVVRRRVGGSYVIKELSGEISRIAVAAFRLLKYHPATEDLSHILADPITTIGGQDGDADEDVHEDEEGDGDDEGEEEDEDDD